MVDGSHPKNTTLWWKLQVLIYGLNSVTTDPVSYGFLANAVDILHIGDTTFFLQI